MDSLSSDHLPQDKVTIGFNPICPWRYVIVASDHPDHLPSASYIKHHVVGIGTCLDLCSDLIWLGPDGTPCRLHFSGRLWPSAVSNPNPNLGLIISTTAFYLCRRDHHIVAVDRPRSAPARRSVLARVAIVTSQAWNGVTITSDQYQWHCISTSVRCNGLGHGQTRLPSSALFPLHGYDRLRYVIGSGGRVRSAIVYGPAGNGKRTRIRAAAADAGLPHLTISIVELFADRFVMPGEAFRAELDAVSVLRPVVITLRSLQFALDHDDQTLCAAIRRLIRQPPDDVIVMVTASDRLPVEFEDAAQDVITLALADASTVLSVDTNVGGGGGRSIADLIAVQRRARWSSLGAALSQVSGAALRDVTVTVPNVPWHEIGGLQATITSLKQIVQWPLQHRSAFAELGVVPLRGCLLYGPPGTGKTLLAQAVATESGSAFVPVAIADLIQAEVGASEAFVRTTFARARDAAPCIIFFDEFQAMFASRDHDPNGALLAQLLAEIDAAPVGVVVLAATNRPDLIDPALLRPGRFDRLLLVPPPDLNGRMAILKHLCHKMAVAEDVSIKDLARLTDGFTGADLQNLIQKAGLCALRRDIAADRIKAQDFDQALGAGMTASVSAAVMNHLRQWRDSLDLAAPGRAGLDSYSFFDS